MTPHHEAARKAAEEMKPCPFCGATPKEYDGNHVTGHALDCFFAQHYAQEMWLVGKRQMNQWNTRFPATGGESIGYITLADAVRHDSPAGFMVFCHNDIDHDYLIFTDERDARDCAFEQEEKSQSEEGAWPVYALWASDWPVKRDAARREAK